MAWLKSLDSWLAIFAILAAIYFLVWKDRIQPILSHLLPSRPAAWPTPLAETEPKIDETISDSVSSIETPENDAEMVSILTILKLVEADLVTETAAITTVFGVKAGGGKEYKRIAARVKAAKNQPADSL